MKRFQNMLLVIAVLALAALPLWTVKRPAPGPDGTHAALFVGSDDKAKELAGSISPSYTPWAKPLIEPPGGRASSLLFALQAALGAGFIGYYIVISKTRARTRRETGSETGC